MLKLIKRLVFSATLLASSTVFANPILSFEMEGDFDINHTEISQALEESRFYVIFEPNIGRSLTHYKDRWGAEYNKHGYEEIRSLVFCNPWYANHVINKDPDMGALCPLSITLQHKNDITYIKFLRPSQINPESPAQDLLIELEQDIVKALKSVVEQ